MVQSIQLIEVGNAAAKPVRDFCPGESMLWNYGMTSVIEAMIPSASGKTIVVQFACGASKRMKADRLSAIGHHYCAECGGIRPVAEMCCNSCNAEAIQQDLLRMRRAQAPSQDIEIVERALSRYRS